MTIDPWGGPDDPVENYWALCLSVATGIDPNRLRSAMFPDAIPFRTAEDAIGWLDGDANNERYWLGIGEREGMTYVWEENGFTGSLPEVVTTVPADTFTSFFWNVSAEQFLHVVGGRVVRWFDPIVPDVGEGQPLPEESGLAWEDDWQRSGLTLLSRVTGTSLPDLSWFRADGVQYFGHVF